MPHRTYTNHLRQLADYLDERQEAILQTWRMTVELERQTHRTQGLENGEFEGQVAALLRFLNREIRSEQILQRQLATLPQTSRHEGLTQKDHPAIKQYVNVRWEHGYNIGQILFEWAQLNLTLVRTLNEYEAADIVDSFAEKLDKNAEFCAKVQAIARVRLLAAQLCDAGYLQIVNEYQSLQQNEIKKTMQWMAEALEQKMQWEQKRGQILREAVHDLRGNLTTIQSAASLLDNAPLEMQSTISCLLQRSTGTLHQMFSQLLDLSRLEAGHEVCQVEKFDAPALMQQLCQLIEPMAQSKGLSLSYSGSAELEVESDILKVRRVAQNLLLNALKYTSEGKVTIECGEVDNERWFLRVSDTGPGLSTDGNSGNTRKDSNGEGVGLEIVKRLCKLLEGTIEVNSVVGEGTSFLVTWPRFYTNFEN